MFQIIKTQNQVHFFNDEFSFEDAQDENYVFHSLDDVIDLEKQQEEEEKEASYNDDWGVYGSLEYLRSLH